VLIFILAVVLYRRYTFTKKANILIREEKNRSDTLLLNILPEEIANELKDTGHVNPRKYDLSTVLFTDFTGFTKQSESISPDILVNSLDYYFQEFDRVIEKHSLEKIKTIGDSYMCVGGIPTPNDKNPVDVLKAAIDMLNFVTKVVPEGIEKFEIRIGIHTGPIIAGIVGIKKFQYDVWGNTVNIASLMESSSDPHKINISQATYNYVKDEFNCIARGEIIAKHGEKMNMYFVEV
jgi:class 3 adenylate cyclase